MELQTIPLNRLAVSALNMRVSRKKPYLDDILPSIRERGVLVPLLVRPNGKENHFEIVAGRRRFLASKAIEKETNLLKFHHYYAFLTMYLQRILSKDLIDLNV